MELKDIRVRLDALDQAAKNFYGFAKEINHLLARAAAIERHLGLQANIKGSLHTCSRSFAKRRKRSSSRGERLAGIRAGRPRTVAPLFA